MIEEGARFIGLLNVGFGFGFTHLSAHPCDYTREQDFRPDYAKEALARRTKLRCNSDGFLPDRKEVKLED